uniref:Uncharacterized protein n=1 Tax=Cacopsylla melanoneura TaxID=428564 RepID=A0A8D8SKT4_9HEMI
MAWSVPLALYSQYYAPYLSPFSLSTRSLSPSPFFFFPSPLFISSDSPPLRPPSTFFLFFFFSIFHFALSPCTYFSYRYLLPVPTYSYLQWYTYYNAIGTTPLPIYLSSTVLVGLMGTFSS